MARSTASTAILPANAGAWAFQVEISPLRDCRVAVVVCSAWPDGLEDRLDVEAEQGADAGGGGRAEVGDVVDLVLVQADRLDQVDLDLVAGGDAADQVRAAGADVLGDGQDRRDVVAGVGVVRGEEGVVVVEFAHGDAVGPGGPLGGDALLDAEDRGALAAGGGAVGQGLGPGCDDRGAVQRGDGHRGVVDDAVDHHVGDLVGDLDGVGGDLGDLPGELVLAGAGSPRSCRRGRGGS